MVLLLWHLPGILGSARLYRTGYQLLSRGIVPTGMSRLSGLVTDLYSPAILIPSRKLRPCPVRHTCTRFNFPFDPSKSTKLSHQIQSCVGLSSSIFSTLISTFSLYLQLGRFVQFYLHFVYQS